jgi:hypothetical protein
VPVLNRHILCLLDETGNVRLLCGHNKTRPHGPLYRNELEIRNELAGIERL